MIPITQESGVFRHAYRYLNAAHHSEHGSVEQLAYLSSYSSWLATLEGRPHQQIFALFLEIVKPELHFLTQEETEKWNAFEANVNHYIQEELAREAEIDALQIELEEHLIITISDFALKKYLAYCENLLANDQAPVSLRDWLETYKEIIQQASEKVSGFDLVEKISARFLLNEVK